MTTSVAAPGDTNPSDATGSSFVQIFRILLVIFAEFFVCFVCVLDIRIHINILQILILKLNSKNLNETKPIFFH